MALHWKMVQPPTKKKEITLKPPLNAEVFLMPQFPREKAFLKRICEKIYDGEKGSFLLVKNGIKCVIIKV